MDKTIIHEILPLGTIVVLKNGTKKVMIIGRIQEEVHTGKQYDYAACLYPEGIIDPTALYMFNQEDIARLYYVGMQDTDEFAFRAYLDDQLKQSQ